GPGQPRRLQRVHDPQVLLERGRPRLGARGVHHRGDRLPRLQGQARGQHAGAPGADPEAPRRARGQPGGGRGGVAPERGAGDRRGRRHPRRGEGEDRPLVLGTKRRLIAAAATVGAAVALALAVSGRGGAVGDGTPAGAARAFVAAARAGDRRAAWELLGPRTRARVEAAAQAATEKVGGARRYGPLDVLDVAAPERTYEPTALVVRTEARAAAV